MGSAASQHSHSTKPIFDRRASRSSWLALALIVTLAASLSCRLTAGPPPRLSPTAPPDLTSLPQPTASPSPARPAGSPAPTQTPVLPPSPTPAVTPASTLPRLLEVIHPENFSRMRRLARLPSDPAEPLAAAGISPDGKSIAAITCYQKVLLWDLATGKVTTGGQNAGDATPTPPERCEPGQELAFSPGWPILASSGSLENKGQHWGAVQVWRVPAGGGLQASQVLTATAKSITSLAFSPDGRLLAAGSSEAQVRIWYVPAILELSRPRPGEPARLPPLATLDLDNRVLSLAFSPDGKALATASSAGGGAELKPVLQIWDISEIFTGGIESITETLSISTDSGPVWDMAFSPAGQLIAAAGTGLALWETAAGDTAERIDDPFDSLAFSPSGDSLAAGGMDQLALWQMLDKPDNSGGKTRWLQDQQSIPSPEGRITRLSFSPDGRFLMILYEQGILDVWGVIP